MVHTFVIKSKNSLPGLRLGRLSSIVYSKSFMFYIYVYDSLKEKSENAGLKLNISKTKIMASGPITSWQINGGKSGNSDLLFSWAPKSQMVTAAMKLKDTVSLEEKL